MFKSVALKCLSGEYMHANPCPKIFPKDVGGNFSIIDTKERTTNLAVILNVKICARHIETSRQPGS
jgi:hypothetical protein